MSASDVEFRTAGAGDLDLLVELRLEYIAADLAVLDAAAEVELATQLRRWLPENLGKRCFARLAFVDGVAASVALLVVNEFPANPRFPRGRVGTVLNVWTRPPYRRRGLAGTLVGDLVQLGADRGLDKLELKASAAGLGVYQALGFRLRSDDHVAMELVYRS